MVVSESGVFVQISPCLEIWTRDPTNVERALYHCANQPSKQLSSMYFDLLTQDTCSYEVVVFVVEVVVVMYGGRGQYTRCYESCAVAAGSFWWAGPFEPNLKMSRTTFSVAVHIVEYFPPSQWPLTLPLIGLQYFSRLRGLCTSAVGRLAVLRVYRCL